MDFQITPTERPRGLVLSGEIDMATAPALKEALLAAMGSGEPVILDMREVTFIDSSGLHVILGAAVSVPNKLVTIKNPSPAVRRVIELIGIEAMPQIEITSDGAHG